MKPLELPVARIAALIGGLLATVLPALYPIKLMGRIEASPVILLGISGSLRGVAGDLAAEYGALGIMAVLFWMLNLALFRADKRPDIGVGIEIAATGLISAGYIVWLWTDHVARAGMEATAMGAVASAFFLALTHALYRRGRRHPAFTTNLACRWLLFFWLYWFALPSPTG